MFLSVIDRNDSTLKYLRMSEQDEHVSTMLKGRIDLGLIDSPSEPSATIVGQLREKYGAVMNVTDLNPSAMLEDRVMRQKLRETCEDNDGTDKDWLYYMRMFEVSRIIMEEGIARPYIRKLLEEQPEAALALAKEAYVATEKHRGTLEEAMAQYLVDGFTDREEIWPLPPPLAA